MAMISSTLVNVSEDAEVRLIRLLAEAAPAQLVKPSFQQECTASITAGDAHGLVKTIVRDAGAVSALLTSLTPDEAAAAMSILAALLHRVQNTEQQQALAQELAQAVVGPKSDAAGADGAADPKRAVTLRKIRLLSILYNMRAEPKEKVGLLTDMVQLAGAYPETLLSADSTLGSLLTDTTASTSTSSTSTSAALTTTTTASAQHQPHLMAWSVPRLANLMDAWKIVPADRRPLYRAVAQALPAGDVRRQRFWLLLTCTYEAGAAVDADGAQAAQEAAKGAIRDPITLFVHQRHLMQLPPVQALEQQDGALYRWLRIFQQGTIADFEETVKNKAADLQYLSTTLGLDVERCRRHMRILTLCTLASEQEEIPYSMVASTLQVPLQSVEHWVIAAVGSGLLQAKMDQLKETVMVERSVVRQFDMAQWKALQSRLSAWKQNVGGILSALQQQQQQPSPNAM